MKRAKFVRDTFSAALLLLTTSAFAAPVVVVDENFDDVTGGPDPRSVKDILDKNPDQLPAGTTFSTFVGTGDTNVRIGNDIINTTAGANGFNTFTPVNPPNRFLVLGDAGGIIGNSPDLGTTRVSFPFTLPADANAILLSFNYAFNGTDTNGSLQPNDIFHVELEGVPHTFLNLPSPIFQSQPFTSTVTGLTPGQRLTLSFYLDETVNTRLVSTISAAGVDNIRVTAVPEPASALLLVLGLTTIGLLYRRKSTNQTVQEEINSGVA